MTEASRSDRQHSLDLEAITVPKIVADDCFNAEVVTQRSRDAIRAVQDRSMTTVTLPDSTRKQIAVAKINAEVHEDASDITITKAGISVAAVAASIRSLLPDSWQHEVSGKLTLAKTGLSMRLRI